MHSIIVLDLVQPDDLSWQCACGAWGTCPRPVAAEVLARHLAANRKVRAIQDLDLPPEEDLPVSSGYWPVMLHSRGRGRTGQHQAPGKGAVMSEGRQVPGTEQRGGDKPDWDSVTAGEPLPQRRESYPEPDSGQLELWPEDDWGTGEALLAADEANDPEAQ